MIRLCAPLGLRDGSIAQAGSHAHLARPLGRDDWTELLTVIRISTRRRHRGIAAAACLLGLAHATVATSQVTVPLPFVPRAMQEAFGTPPSVVAAQAEVARARGQQAAAGVPADWFVSAGASEVPNGDFAEGNIRLEIGREILPNGRRAAERALADADLARATAELDAVTRQAQAVLIRTSAHALGWELIRRRRAAQDSLLTRAEDALRSRFSVGQARYLDVLRLRTERLRVASTIAAAQAESRGATSTLLSLVGGPEDRARVVAALASVDSMRDPWTDPIPEVPDPDTLAAHATALVLARAGIARATAERARQQSTRGSQGNAFAGIQRIGQAADGPAFGPTIGITLSLPFLTGGATRRIVAAADSGVAAAEARATATTAETSARLAAATARYAGARERLAVFDAALLRGVQSEREVALANYRAGTLSLLELLDFERALADAEIGRLESLLAAADAWADLQQAMAGAPITESPE